MGYQIIKQPDGRLALFSSFTDTLAMWDANRDEVLDFFIELSTADTRRSVLQKLEQVESGHPRAAYAQFAMTWDEAVEESREHGLDVTDPKTLEKIAKDSAKQERRDLDRMAKAAKKAAGVSTSWKALPETVQDEWRRVAQAVLAARTED